MTNMEYEEICIPLSFSPQKRKEPFVFMVI
jgi:hypothetical protein